MCVDMLAENYIPSTHPSTQTQLDVYINKRPNLRNSIGGQNHKEVEEA